MKAVDSDEMVEIIEAARGTMFEVPVLLAGTCGMRRGEILGLGWENVALDQTPPSVTVVRGLVRAQGHLHFVPPKTQKARRRIILTEAAAEGLRRHRARQAEHRLRLGEAYQDQGLVCPGPLGHPRDPDGFGSMFSKWIRRTGLPRIRFHDLRHTHATQGLLENIHPKIISERLGHSSVGITLDTYSHVLPGCRKKP